mgnify:CR=1 FL=1
MERKGVIAAGNMLVDHVHQIVQLSLIHISEPTGRNVAGWRKSPVANAPRAVRRLMCC